MGLILESYPKSMNSISSLQQPNLNQLKVYCATKTVLGAFMSVSFLVRLVQIGVKMDKVRKIIYLVNS